MLNNETFLTWLVAAVKAAGRYNQNEQVVPVAILWPDEARQWSPLLPALRRRLPLLTLGDYDPARRTGPAYYLRCLIARALPEDRLPEGDIPIIYLPGFGKRDLRAIETCPPPLQPLAELQYRGALWVNPNGRDWSVTGFLHALGAPVATDNATREALARAMSRLADEPVARLQQEAPLRAEFFNELLHPDAVRQMLLWLSAPEAYRRLLPQPEWQAFCALSRQKYGLDPEKDGPLSAAERLNQASGEWPHASGEWAAVWARYTEAPVAYPGIPDLLRQAQPKQLPLFGEPSPVWPAANEQAEKQVRGALAALRHRSAGDAREAVRQLEEQHGQRRDWVWAKLGEAPLAMTLVHLTSLAELTASPLGGDTTTQVASNYVDWGWQVDAAVLRALAAVEAAPDVAAVKNAIIPLYRPWLEQATRRFQAVVLQSDGLDYETGQGIGAEPGTCILFSDALRFDVGRQLAQHLTDKGFLCATDWQLAALPPVTATAKPAISPAAAAVAGGDKPGLVPVSKESGTSLGTELFRKLVRDRGYQELKDEEQGEPAGRGWAEYGAIDRYGHDHGWKIAHHVSGELRGLGERIAALLNHGWRQVTVVTDHGWLLLPDGMPKAELPQHLTITRKGRCAVVREDAPVAHPVVPWHWNPEVRIAVAPDIHCFEAGKEYEHGGLSPQECVVPVITVRRDGGDTAPVVIEEVKWLGLRCNVRLSGGAADVLVDIRLKAGDAGSTVAAMPKSPDASGAVSLLAPDETLGGSAAFIVVSRGEAIQAQRLTVIGGE